MHVDPTRFDRVLEHPDYPSAPAQPVLPADAGIAVAAIAGPLLLSLFGAVFLLVAITLLLAIQPPFLVSLLFVGAGVVFVGGGIAMARTLIAMRDAPIERQVAVIVRERTDVGGREHTDTSYYATLQTRDGTRTEYRISRALVGRLVVGDIGVAYVKHTDLDLGIAKVRARRLVEFIRFDVE